MNNRLKYNSIAALTIQDIIMKLNGLCPHTEHNFITIYLNNDLILVQRIYFSIFFCNLIKYNYILISCNVR